MKIYANIEKKKFVGVNNTNVIYIFNFEEESEITVIPYNNKNQKISLSTTSGLYFAGSTKLAKSSENLLFMSTTYSINNDYSITFDVDSYTENYLNLIKSLETPIYLEFGYVNHGLILAQSIEKANPRVYIDGLPPSPLSDYYTKDESDSKFMPISGSIGVSKEYVDNQDAIISSNFINYAKLDDLEVTSGEIVEQIPTKTSDLTNDLNFSTISYVDSGLSGKLDNENEINFTTNNVVLYSNKRIYDYDISSDTTFSFDLTNLNTNKSFDFEFHISMPLTSYTLTFPSGIIWIEDPDFSEANKLYCICMRKDEDNRLLANLAYGV